MKNPFVLARAKWLGAALFSVSLGLSGCGGGGGNSGPHVTPTPTPIPTSANLTYNKTRYTPNYVNDLEADRATTPIKNPIALLRWTHFPLSVYFARDGSYSADTQALAVQGFNRWVSATGSNGVSYNVVNSATNVDIIVNLGVFTGGAGGILGRTDFSYDQQSRVFKKGVEIMINLTGDRNNDLITATHEFGHALGINGHSLNPKDLMYFEGNEPFGGNITTSDLDTTLTSYDGIFNKDVNTRIAPGNGKIISASIE